MAELHSTLEKLGPVDYTDVPQDDLVGYLKSHLLAGELICNSVPSPPGGDSFETANPSKSEPDLAASAKDISASSARYPDTHSDHVSLQDSWGKAVKVGNKENPLDVKVYKMAGHDRHGAWFARRSIHEGLSFSKFRNALKWEFLESLATEGGPGAGAVRGIGVDKRLEDLKADNTGRIQVYQLSAQFPGPTTPRDFAVLLMTSENALTEKSSVEGEYIPRHFMILSKPVTHPAIPARDGYIRGHYESVEMIREVPLHKRTSNSTASLNTDGSKDSLTNGHGAELNPVEWIMVTRSDPGGGIPRFMVERGTPASITADVVKFFDWACKKTDIPDTDEENAVDEALEKHKREVEHAPPAGKDDPAVGSSQPAVQGGYLQSASHIIQAGLDAYAPTSIANAAHNYLDPQPITNNANDDDDDSDTSSYESADDDFHTAGLGSTTSLPRSDSITSQPSTPSSSTTQKPTNNHDKEVAKIDSQKRKLEERIAKRREAEAAKLKSQQEDGNKSSTDLAKLRDKSERDLRKSEEKHAKEVEKLEERRKKELERAVKKRQKQYDRDVVQKLTRERDDFRTRVELIQRENELLREQIGDVQRENTVLVRNLTKLTGGDRVMQVVREELKEGRKRATSSVKSGDRGRDA